MSRWLVVCLALSLIEGMLMGYFGVLRPDLLLERIPIHWDINMQPDGWTTREGFAWYVLISPGVMLLITGLAASLPWLSPKNYEIERFAGTFGFVITCLVIFFGWMGLLILWAGVEENPPYFASCFVASFFGLFAVLGAAMGKVKRNYWMGIRTPWTLSNEVVWDRTHQFAGWLWGSVGAVGGVAVLLGLPFWIGMTAILLTALVPVVYSLILYKSLPKEDV